MTGNPERHAAAPPGRFDLLGCPVDAVSFASALGWCRDAAARAPRAAILLTVNASHVVAMQEPGGFRDACLAADRFVADGISVVWASWLLGHRVPGRITGCDLLTALLEGSRDQPLRVFFLGARPEVMQRLVRSCEDRYPGLAIAGYRDGFFKPTEQPAVIEQIRASGADVLFIGMPSPFKDVWGQQHRDAFGVRLIIGVGGAFDVLAGLLPRAPVWMQRIGLEWLWRLALEPARLWRRVLLGGSWFTWLVLRQFVRQRLSRWQGRRWTNEVL